MAFPVLPLFVGALVIERNSGLERRRALQLAALPAAIGLPLPTAVAMSALLGQREEAPARPVPAAVASGIPALLRVPAAVAAPPPLPPPLVLVPNLIGSPESEATEELHALGLATEVAPITTESERHGVVVRQSPESDVLVESRSAVLLVVGAPAPSDEVEAIEKR